MGLDTLGTRSLVTFVFGPFILFCAWRGGYLFLALIASIVVLAMNEFYDLAAHKLTRPQRLLGLAAGAAGCLLLFFGKLHLIWLLFLITFVCVLIFELFRNETGPMLNVATTLAGLAGVGYLLGFLIAIRELPLATASGVPLTGRVMILIFLCVWLCDSAAYLLGSKIGKHKLFERVSPNKTIEGTVSGLMTAVLTAVVCQMTFLREFDLVHALVIGGICGSVGQVSDLLESLLKRDAGVKDASSLIPGHGGILDRFDSEILVAPMIYLYLAYIVS